MREALRLRHNEKPTCPETSEGSQSGNLRVGLNVIKLLCAADGHSSAHALIGLAELSHLSFGLEVRVSFESRNAVSERSRRGRALS